MKIKKGFVVRKIAGEDVVVALGAASKHFNGLIKLNETGRFLWDKLSVGCEEGELIDAISAEYDVDRDIAAKDIRMFVDTLKGAGVIE
ncbi:MAG: PqqD family protein [Ruminococcaceae bacterium]|nr:PqqD family protein [Oscillospiraceae bacterium]